MKQSICLELIIRICFLKFIISYISSDVLTTFKTMLEFLIISLKVILNCPILKIYLKIYNSEKKQKLIEKTLYILELIYNII